MRLLGAGAIVTALHLKPENLLKELNRNGGDPSLVKSEGR